MSSLNHGILFIDNYMLTNKFYTGLMTPFTRNTSDLGMENFSIAVFKTKSVAIDKLMAWKDEQKIFALESCARQSWLGTRTDFENMPLTQQERERVTVYSGAEAYGYLLKLLCGLDGDTPGDNQEVARVNKGFEAFKQNYPEKASVLEKIIEHMRSDVRVIREQTSNHMLAPRPGRAAVMLANPPVNSPALVITRMANDGNIDRNAMDILQIISKARQHRASKIYISIPQDEHQAALQAALDKWIKEAKIDCPIEYVPWQVLMTRGFSEADTALRATYVTTPIENSDADCLLWSYGQQLTITPLVMLRGGSNENKSTSFWKEAADKKDNNIILSEDIDNQRDRVKRSNQDLRESGARMIINCVHSRMANKRPIKKDLKLPSEQYCHRSGIQAAHCPEIDSIGIKGGGICG